MIRKILILLLMMIPILVVCQEKKLDYSPFNFSTPKSKCLLAYRISLEKKGKIIWLSEFTEPYHINDSLAYIKINIPLKFIDNGKVTIKKEAIPGPCVPTLGLINIGELKTSFVKVKFNSQPSNAKIYLIPLLDWVKFGKPKVDELKNMDNFNVFSVAEGNTPIIIYLPEINYKAIFAQGSSMNMVDCKVIKSRPQNSIFISFE